MAHGHRINIPPIEIDISRELVSPQVHSILLNFKFYLFITLFIYTLYSGYLECKICVYLSVTGRLDIWCLWFKTVHEI